MEVFFFSNNPNANNTLHACASTVAIAAPAASKWKPATKTKSPTILIRHATATKSKGDLLSPKPLKIADNTL